MLVFIRLDI